MIVQLTDPGMDYGNKNHEKSVGILSVFYRELHGAREKKVVTRSDPGKCGHGNSDRYIRKRNYRMRKMDFFNGSGIIRLYLF